MNRLSWQVKLSVGLVALSVALNGIHVLIFHDFYHVAYYFLMDLAFIPVEVLFVTIILHQVLTSREKRQLLKKLNMVIGAFFSEIGTPMLVRFGQFCSNVAEIGPSLMVGASWTDEDFQRSMQWLNDHNLAICSESGDLSELKAFLVERRDFLLRLLENPNLLEHEAFTELLWAVFHLTEELASRTDPTKLPVNDYNHLSGDIRRAYVLVIREWLGYMNHLRQNYPYLYSLALRTDPFDPHASAEVQ